MTRVKWLLYGSAVGFVAAVTLLIWCERKPETAGPSAAAAGRFPAARYREVPVAKTPSSPLSQLNPVRKKTPAEKLLAGTPAGTEVFEIRTAHADDVVIYRTGDGAVFVPAGEDATVSVYRKTAPWLAAEFRPAVWAITDCRVAGVGASVGVARLGMVHVGPAATYDAARRVALGAAVSYNLWRNVDVGVSGGKVVGKPGWWGGVGAALAID